jgi:hypothetical protein
MNTEILNRSELAQRWGVSIKTVDRLRTARLLNWIDIGGGRHPRPIVRFTLADVERYESGLGQTGARENG